MTMQIGTVRDLPKYRYLPLDEIAVVKKMIVIWDFFELGVKVAGTET